MGGELQNKSVCTFSGAVLAFRQAMIASFGDHRGADNDRDRLKSRIFELYLQSPDQESRAELRLIAEMELGRPEADAPEQLNAWLVYLTQGLAKELENYEPTAHEKVVKVFKQTLADLQLLQRERQNSVNLHLIWADD